VKLLVVRLLITFCSSFDQTAHLEGFVKAVLVRSLAMLRTGRFIYLLLHKVTQSGKGCGSATSILEDNSRLLKDTFYKMFSPC
jgi:hypothetical protein